MADEKDESGITNDGDHRRHHRNHGAPRAVWGGLIVILGVLFLLQSVYNIHVIHYFWPIILIVIGLGLMFGRRR